MYLVAVMDWHSRKVLSWRVSNTLESEFCIEALEQALLRYGKPEIFNTDQGAQFTSRVFVGLLESHRIKVSMDGKGRWMDNVFIVRLWQSVKYEEIYLFEHATIIDLSAGLEKWFQRYNDWRPHEALGNETPTSIYQSQPAKLPQEGDKKAA